MTVWQAKVVVPHTNAVEVPPSGADSSTQREFPSDKVYRRDDCGVLGVESTGPQGLAFFVIHTSVVRAACRYGSPLVHGRFRH
jgi:hypothetical protein